MEPWSPLADEAHVLMADATMVAVGLGLVFAFVMWLVSHEKTKAREKEWLQLGAELGLDTLGAFHLVGELEGQKVAADIIKKGSGKNQQYFTQVEVRGQLPGGFELGKEGFFSQLVGSDLKIGDEDFDAAVIVKGELVRALAILDGETRQAVKSAVRDGWSYADRAWTCLVPGRIGGDELRAVLQTGVLLGQRFEKAAGQIPERLEARVRHDAHEEARLQALELLLAHHAKSGATQRALTAATADRAAAVRLVAARYLDDVPLLVKLALGADEPEAIEAFESLALRHPKEPETAPVMDAWVAEHPNASHRAKVALLEALGTVPHPRAEELLVAALEEAEPDERKLAAMKSLGMMGGIGAVAALVPYREKLLSFTLKAAAKQAILEIQARHAGAEAGALSLSGEGGGLALTASSTRTGDAAELGAETGETVEEEA